MKFSKYLKVQQSSFSYKNTRMSYMYRNNKEMYKKIDN